VKVSSGYSDGPLGESVVGGAKKDRERWYSSSDVECASDEFIASLSSSFPVLLSPGDIVVRGKDWKWDNQDGGDGKQGTVVAPGASDGWIDVRWKENGVKANYRYGAESKYDIRKVGGSTGTKAVG